MRTINRVIDLDISIIIMKIKQWLQFEYSRATTGNQSIQHEYAGFNLFYKLISLFTSQVFPSYWSPLPELPLSPQREYPHLRYPQTMEHEDPSWLGTSSPTEVR